MKCPNIPWLLATPRIKPSCLAGYPLPPTCTSCPLDADLHILCSLLPPGCHSHDPVCWNVLSAPPPVHISLLLVYLFRVATSGHLLQEAFLILNSGLDATHLYFSSNHSFFFFFFFLGEFPGDPVVRTQRSHCWGPGSIPGRGTKIPQAAWHGQEINN